MSGGVEEWRSGGVEEWRSGGVEEWRGGGLGMEFFLNHFIYTVQVKVI